MSLEQCIYLSFRTFVLQFVLLGKNDHMTMCFQSSDNKWHLYDNDKTKPPFQSFDLESMKDYEDRLGGYVNITQVQEHKLSTSFILISVWVWDIF